MVMIREMFSPVGGPKDGQGDIDYADDLKFFIDNESELLSRQMFPGIKKHLKHRDHPHAYKFYLKPLQKCCKIYANKFKLENIEQKITKEQLIGLAKQIAAEQNQHIARGDYDVD